MPDQLGVQINEHAFDLRPDHARALEELFAYSLTTHGVLDNRGAKPRVELSVVLEGVRYTVAVVQLPQGNNAFYRT